VLPIQRSRPGCSCRCHQPCRRPSPCHQCQVLTATTKQSMARFPPLLLALPTPKLLPTAGGCWYCSAQDVGQAPSTATSPTGRRPSPCHQRQALAATRRQQCSRRRPYTLPCRHPSYNRDRMLPIPGLQPGYSRRRQPCRRPSPWHKIESGSIWLQHADSKAPATAPCPADTQAADDVRCSLPQDDGQAPPTTATSPADGHRSPCH